MAKIADLIISLSADIASFRSGMEEANQHLSKLRQESSMTADALSKLKEMAGAVISIEAVKSVLDFSYGLVSAAETTLTLAQSLGISSDAFQALSLAAKQANINQETFRNDMSRLATAAQETAEGIGGNTARAFAKLGVSVTDIHGNILPLDNILQQVAVRLGTVKSAAEQAALANELMGRNGSQLIPMLQEMRERGLDRMIESAKEMGVVLSQDDLTASNNLMDQLDVLSTVVRNNLTQALLAVGPELIQLAKDLNEAAQGASALLNGGLLSDFSGLSKQGLQKQLSVVEQTLAEEKQKLAGMLKTETPVYLPWSVDPMQKDIADARNIISQLELEERQIKGRIASYTEPAKLGKPVVDPEIAKAASEAAKRVDEYRQSLQGWLNSTRDATQFQLDLSKAYDQGTDAVKQLEAAEAGHLALQKQLDDAGRAGVQLHAQQVRDIFDAAVAQKQATQALEDHRKALQDQANFDRSSSARLTTLSEQTDYYQRLAAAHQQGKQAEREMQDQLAGEAAVRELLNDAQRTGVQVSAQLLQTTYNRAVAEKQAELASQSLKSQDKDSTAAMAQLTDQVARGASNFLEFATSMDRGKNSGREFQRMVAGLAEDLSKTILQLTVLNPLQNELGVLLVGPSYRQMPVIGGGAPGAGSGRAVTPSGGASNVLGEFLKWGAGELGTGLADIGKWLGIIPHAKGGIFSETAYFPVGSMAENGPEAIMPLARTGSGDLGVRVAGGAAPAEPVINLNVHNYSGQQVQTRRNGRDLDVIVGESVSRDFYRGGPAARAASQRFGVTQQPVSR